MPAPSAYSRRTGPIPGPSSYPTGDRQAALYDASRQFVSWSTVALATNVEGGQTINGDIAVGRTAAGLPYIHTDGGVLITSTLTTQPQLTIKGTAAQTANALEIRDSGNNLVISANIDGTAHFKSGLGLGGVPAGQVGGYSIIGSTVNFTGSYHIHLPDPVVRTGTIKSSGKGGFGWSTSINAWQSGSDTQLLRDAAGVVGVYASDESTYGGLTTGKLKVGGTSTSGYFTNSAASFRAATVGDGGTNSGDGAVVSISQLSAWGGNQQWALYVSGYTYLNGFRVAGSGQRALYLGTEGGQLDFASNQGIVTFTNGFLGTQERMRINTDGKIGVGISTAPDGQFHVVCGASTTKGLVVRGAASQTANPIEIQDSAGIAGLAVSSDFRLVATNSRGSDSIRLREYGVDRGWVFTTAGVDRFYMNHDGAFSCTSLSTPTIVGLGILSVGGNDPQITLNRAIDTGTARFVHSTASVPDWYVGTQDATKDYWISAGGSPALRISKSTLAVGVGGDPESDVRLHVVCGTSTTKGLVVRGAASQTANPIEIQDSAGNFVAGFDMEACKISGANPGFWLNETGSGLKGCYVVLDGGLLQFQRRAQNFGGYEGAPIIFNITSGRITAAELKLTGLPTADPVDAGVLWNDSGTLKISAG